jgi:hypothetical protein
MLPLSQEGKQAETLPLSFRRTIEMKWERAKNQDKLHFAVNFNK